VWVCASCGQENPDGFKFCGGCGTPLVAPAPPREVRKVVTIVFCDLTGSTALGDRTDPEALRATMRGYYEEMRTILERHGGSVEKFVGDAVMAVFGVPVSNEDDALRAVRAAWEMRTAVPQLGLQARIGVNTGEVVTGEGDTLVTGDAVNVAARLEQTAAPGDVLIGDETRRLVRDAVQVEPVEVAAKGKPEPIAAFRVTELDPGASGVARRLDTPLVGRARELSLLRQAFDRVVAERSCHLFTLLGPAGVGKSRLTAEFLNSVDATIAHGRCLDYGDGITLWPVIGVLKQLGADETIERITGTLPATELFWSVRNRLEQEAENRPLVVVFEDIHWGESTFLDLIDHISDLTRDVPLMLLCIARPELLDERPGWAGGKLNATTTLLEPLSNDAAAALVESLGDDLEQTVRDRVLAAAGGNPLFVEEMVALAREDGDVRAPATVQALLQARLDRLPPAQRSVIERGAVEGEIFHRLSVTELSGEPIDGELVGLVRKELIRRERGTIADDDAYRFRHLLIRDAAYDALPKETRADLHERFARWLERRGGLVELDEILGHHFEQAALYRRGLGRGDEALDRAAAKHLTAAGEAARRREDFIAAEKLLERALALTPLDAPVRGSLVRTLAAALISSRPSALEPLYEELQRNEDPVLAMNGTVLRAYFNFMHGEAAQTADGPAEIAAEAIELFTRAGDDAGLADAWSLLAQVHWIRCRAVETLAAAEQAVAARRRVGSHPGYMWILGPLGHGPFKPEEVRQRFASLLEQDQGRYLAAIARVTESSLLSREGRFDESFAAWAEADARLAELGQTFMRTIMAAERGMIAWAQGDLERAERAIRAEYDRLGEMGEAGFRSTMAINLGTIAYELGRPEEATTLAHAGEEMGGPDDLTNMVIGPALRAKILADQGDVAKAEELARRSVELAQTGDLPEMRAQAWNALGHVLLRQSRVDQARDAHERELLEHESHGDVVQAMKVRALLVEL
jgi:class 3 adenylate cyclase/tetratricopeptide (TPR) repeat protein